VAPLRELTIKGYKSIRDQRMQLRDLNVFIGANGAGKSNLLSFFDMLGFMTTGTLQQYVAENGYASSFLYYGPQTTPVLEAKLVLEMEQGTNHYDFRLAHAANDIFIFADERVAFARRGREGPTEPRSLGAGHKESRLQEQAEADDLAAKSVLWALQRYKSFHFHDTSRTAKIRNSGYVEDNRYLRSDGGNLAAYLRRLRITHSDNYDRILSTIRQIVPFHGDFVLEPRATDVRHIMLDWRERNSNVLFGPHQLADGALRAMALVTLLLQPSENLPLLIVIDEPELGLHPYAIGVVADLLRQVSHHSQVLISTQSTTLVDQFEPEDIVVVERADRQSTFKRLSSPDLAEWLEEYTLSEIWDKNVVGGRPEH